MAGVFVSAPVGPVSVLCLRYTLLQGALGGMAIACGTILADLLYAILMMCGLSDVSQRIMQYPPLLLLSGIIFCLWGVREWRLASSPEKINQQANTVSFSSLDLVRLFGKSFLLTGMNPATAATFLGISAFFFSDLSSFFAKTVALTGFFCGSVLWWTFVVWGVLWGKKRNFSWTTWMSLLHRLSAVFLWMASGYGLLRMSGVLT